jgi:hypothetical protein
MSNISPQKNACTPEQNISLRNLCEHIWLEEILIKNISSNPYQCRSTDYWVDSMNCTLSLATRSTLHTIPFKPFKTYYAVFVTHLVLTSVFASLSNSKSQNMHRSDGTNGVFSFVSNFLSLT